MKGKAYIQEEQLHENNYPTYTVAVDGVDVARGSNKESVEEVAEAINNGTYQNHLADFRAWKEENFPSK